MKAISGIGAMPNHDGRKAGQKICDAIIILQRVIDNIDSRTITPRGIRAEINRAIMGPLTTARIHAEFAGLLGSPLRRSRRYAELPVAPDERATE